MNVSNNQDAINQNLLIDKINSTSIISSLNDELNKENQLNQTMLSQQSSNYQTIRNIVPSPIQTLNEHRKYSKSDFDYTIKSLVADDNNVKNFLPYDESTMQNDTMGHKLKEKSIREYNRRKEELQEFYQKLLRTINDSINIIKAVVMRLLFSFHSLIAISYVYIVKRDEWYFVNVVGVVFLLIELFITIIKRRGHEPTGFFPSFFIYICTMIPPIWFVELSRIDQANRARAKARVKQNLESNLTGEWHLEHDETDHLVHLSETLGLNESLGLGLKINEAIPLNTTTIAVYLEISLMILIILGRWFLPKGDLSRSALSQLLLVYMSLGSDMIDLLSLLNEPNVQESKIMTYFTLSIFSWSMFQFSLNLVVNRGRSFVIEKDSNEEETLNEGQLKSEFEELEDLENNGSRSFIQNLDTYVRMHYQNEDFKNENEKKICGIPRRYLRMNVFDSEMWSILITMIFQDGPFLGIRLAAVIRFEVRTFVTLFYTCKNAIILFLQCYRLSAIYTEATKDQNADKATKDDAIASLNAASLQLDKYVILSYKRDLILKKQEDKNKSSKKSNLSNEQEILHAEKKLLELNPIFIKSSLSNHHSYSINLTSNSYNNILCCDCECHKIEIG